jgi:hypothetical protein
VSINQCLNTCDVTRCDVGATYGIVFARPNSRFEACIFNGQCTIRIFMDLGEVILLNKRFHLFEPYGSAGEVDEMSKHLSGGKSHRNISPNQTSPFC